ncbi:hypothetical protein EIP86_006572 [Pleurotus ostreatoroseus]|nr:hypothetical protein EIP86_006572 [Pleurotus ostreatoroseus]
MDNTELRKTSDTNPWKEIERTVRTVDEEKVKDCTEDVDALLVFAGLYSAVLTAFLIESYKTLQADPVQDYLRQIAFQTSSYTLTNGYLNATLSSQPPPFQAPESAIRVNVCWFASLILSLTSASFGILVKQWLREFLAIPYISPQERIRIRDARVQGLGTWKLFEIASFLPALLQISLALFFVGLCFFTAAVHPSIGTTTSFLVCCWAFVFCLSVIAPLVSPRCPYKTTALKAALRHARPYIRSLLQSVPSQLVLSSLTIVASSVVATVWLSISGFYSKASEYFHKWKNSHDLGPASFSSAPAPETTNAEPESGNLADLLDDCINLPILRQVLPSVFEESAISPEDTVYENGEEEDSTKDPDSTADLESTEGRDSTEVHDNTEDSGTNLVQSRMPSTVQVGQVILLYEEEDNLRSTVDNDLIIFRRIDASFFDDNLLSLMQKSLQLQPRPLRYTLNFVTNIFKSRLGSHLVNSPAQPGLPQKIPWPWTLSRISRAAMAGILADSMAYELSYHRPRHWKKLSETDSEWSICLAFIILLVAPKDVPSSVPRLIQVLTQDVLKGDLNWNPLDIFSYQMKILAQYDDSWPGRSLVFLAQSIELLKAEDASRCLAYVAYASFVAPDEELDEDSYRSLLERTRPNTFVGDGDTILPSPQRIATLLDAARVILHKYTLEQTDSDEFPYCIEDLLDFVFDALPIHHPCNDDHHEPRGVYSQSVVAQSQVPNAMIDVLRRSVCNVHGVDPETEKTFWRIEHLQNLDRLASHAGAPACPSSKTVESESEPKLTTVTGELDIVDVLNDSPDLSSRSIANGYSTSSMEASSDNARHHEEGESLSDKLERLLPLPEFVARTVEEETEELGHAFSRKRKANEDEDDDGPKADVADCLDITKFSP